MRKLNNRRLKRELEERYNPVPHDKAFDDKLFGKPGVKAAFDALEEEYVALHALLAARKAAGLTQVQIAERMGTTASAVSRLEASLSSERHSPSFVTLSSFMKTRASAGRRP